jgi:hypothetical protein
MTNLKNNMYYLDLIKIDRWVYRDKEKDRALFLYVKSDLARCACLFVFSNSTFHQELLSKVILFVRNVSFAIGCHSEIVNEASTQAADKDSNYRCSMSDIEDFLANDYQNKAIIFDEELYQKISDSGLKQQFYISNQVMMFDTKIEALLTEPKCKKKLYEFLINIFSGDNVS